MQCVHGLFHTAQSLQQEQEGTGAGPQTPSQENLLSLSFKRSIPNALKLTLCRGNFPSFLPTICYRKTPHLRDSGSLLQSWSHEQKDGRETKRLQGLPLTIPNLSRCQHHCNSAWSQCTAGARVQILNAFPFPVLT